MLVLAEGNELPEAERMAEHGLGEYLGQAFLSYSDEVDRLGCRASQRRG